MQLAWFSPLPPDTSGIAAYSAEILPLLTARGFEIVTFTERNAHEFVWRQRRRPYDLTVYQLGNAACHDYMWAYLFRYPGLVTLHDVQLHQARALFLTKRWEPRVEDYAAEVHANHPDAPADLPYLVLARMADRMYQHWPMVRLVIQRARLTVVHNEWVAVDLRRKHPAANIRAISMGVAQSGSGPQAAATGTARPPSAPSRHSAPSSLGLPAPGLRIPDNAIVVGAFGGVTPEKRIPQLIRAIAALSERHATLHLMLVGSPMDHYDVHADAEACGVADRVHTTGFVPDAELAAYFAAADICACLRWPTNRETSASWLRCLAAGRPTIVTELVHLGDVPTLDPRGWRVLDTQRDARTPVAVSIDILDEANALQLALDRLASDRPLRERLGHAAYNWWSAHHQLDAMAAAYDEVIRAAMEAPVPQPQLPRHLLADGTSRLHALAGSLGVRVPDFLDG